MIAPILLSLISSVACASRVADGLTVSGSGGGSCPEHSPGSFFVRAVENIMHETLV